MPAMVERETPEQQHGQQRAGERHAQTETEHAETHRYRLYRTGNVAERVQHPADHRGRPGATGLH
ncbi:hypothetical protein, partial [Sphingomonas sp. 66-10]|uniref:hypothetical protein n=1 Tax=Sphingomonas sp. 66-10 TaxID=1895848 RepID=UPI00257FD0D3